MGNTLKLVVFLVFDQTVPFICSEFISTLK